MSRTEPVVDIVLSVHDGAPYVGEQIESIRGQTHEHWRLSVRDDGSTDGTYEIVERWAQKDPRIHLHPRDGRRLGAGPGFGWLLERLPDDARYVFCSDADDCWIPEKVEITLVALLEAGGDGEHPVLVHTDLTVADRDLRTVHPSFWEYQSLDPEPVTLRRLLVQNVVTGPTIAMNRALAERVTPIPDEAIHQDWWIALVAGAFARVVALRRSTVLYRQHGANAAGAHNLAEPSVADLTRRFVGLWSRGGRFREGLAATARQAAAFLERYGSELEADSRRLLREYAEIPECGFLRRKMRVLRLRVRPEHGVLRNLAALLRA